MRSSSDWLLLIAATCMLLALACDNITLASEDYRGVLLAALLGMAVADSCCAVAFVGGGPRWAALVIAAPSLFIVWDLVRRVPVVFR
jgi:hypothetical protein